MPDGSLPGDRPFGLRYNTLQPLISCNKRLDNSGQLIVGAEVGKEYHDDLSILQTLVGWGLHHSRVADEDVP